MKVAAYQAPYLPFGSFEAVGLIKDQIAHCEIAGVDLLCCPEAILGGLAHESAGQSPSDVALGVESGELARVLSPLMDSPVSFVVGFTERDGSGNLFLSAAVVLGGELAGVYRKAYPGYRTVIQPGSELPVYQGEWGSFGVMICNDIWYIEPARILSARGAAAILVPSNSGHVRTGEVPNGMRARGSTLAIARAVENTTTIVVADIAGRQGDRQAIGCSRIIDPDGIVMTEADADQECLLVADIESQRREYNPRGWDGHINSSVSEAFRALRMPSEAEG